LIISIVLCLACLATHVLVLSYPTRRSADHQIANELVWQGQCSGNEVPKLRRSNQRGAGGGNTTENAYSHWLPFTARIHTFVLGCSGTTAQFTLA